MTHIKRGQIYFLHLDPVFGHEIGGYKTRPVVVLSINDINSKPLVVSVVPGTSAASKAKDFPNVVLIKKSNINKKSGEWGLDSDTNFHCEQIRAIDRGRFVQRAIGSVSEYDLTRISDAVKYCLGMQDRSPV